jgi:uncharacterized protein (TIGR02466 family)
MTSNITFLFPTQFYQSKLGAIQNQSEKQFNSDIEVEMKTFRKLDSVGQKWSKKHYLNGYTSYSSISDMHKRSTTFEQLMKAIDRHVLKFSKSLEMNLQGRKLKMSNCWMNIMGANCHHSFHIHPLSVISGTYYVSVPKGASNFRVEDPRMDCFMGSPARTEECKIENKRHFEITPKAGELVLFESWLRHEVPSNPIKGDRLSISFNYGW